MQPTHPKIYHILHLDRLPSILADGCLYSDRIITQRPNAGTMIGMSHIKQRRMNQLRLSSHPSLYVGDCVPFYFCPRSVMLYIIHSARSDDLAYKAGQKPIIHLEADLYEAINWAAQNQLRWAFTQSNAGSFYFEDFADTQQLRLLNWPAIHTNNWAGANKEGKQAEFLLENFFPWHLVRRIGVYGTVQFNQVQQMLMQQTSPQPTLEVKRAWYY